MNKYIDSCEQTGCIAARSGPRFSGKRPVFGRWVAVLDHVRRDRGLRLNGFRTRCIRSGDVHEILVVRESVAGSSTWDEVGYLGFGVFDIAGVLAAGDLCYAGDRLIGVLLGFDNTHEPNHMNVVLRAPEIVSGAALHLRPDDQFHFDLAQEV
jgi:hypothetical protein